MFYLKMVLAALTPVILTVIFYFLESKTKFGSIKKTTRQIIIGIVYGVVACLATQFGVAYDGYVLNVRSASPLTAGLIFGGPAGIIAGIIGGLYRWLSIYWGIGSYTVIACSVATILAGLLGSLGNRLFIKGKRNTWYYGVFIAIANEVFHMLLVFVTHMDGIPTAFAVVQETTLPMVIANAISVFLSLVFVEFCNWYKDKKINNSLAQDDGVTLQTKIKNHSTPSITQTFSILLLVVVIVLFFVTSTFTYSLQSNVSDIEVESLLSMNVEDVKNDFQQSTDGELLEKTYVVKNDFDNYFSNGSYMINAPTQQSIYAKYNLASGNGNYLFKNGISEINIIGKDGIVLFSSKEENVGYDMNSGEQSKAFLCLLNGETEYVQDFQAKSQEKELNMKYAAVAVSEKKSMITDEITFEGGFIQVGYNYEQYMNSVKNNLKDLANNRHIGQEGFTFILSEADGELISTAKTTVTVNGIETSQDCISAEYCKEFSKTLAAYEYNKVYSYTNADGIEYFYFKTNIECYDIVGCIPVSEAEFSMNTAVYIGAFMQLVVFSVLFIIVFILLKRIVVDNVQTINKSLAQITAGNLDTRVEIKGKNEEFISLSNDINATVVKLEEYISDAEKRIDMELQFAKSIQTSVLPSVFPPYPNRNEFDIYASMDPAKEVGGDFYDFYLLDENHLVFLVADVSGKGIPAAMFMMNAKTMIHSLTESGLSVAEAFTTTNAKLCESNDAGMFVTAWMGILDLTTGSLKFANAGHNPPCIKRKNGTFEFLKAKHGLVLAGMDGIVYKENEIILNEGDEIFLYTDGVTEATNTNNELFGEERLIKRLNECESKDAISTCKFIKDKMDEFVGDAPQFDDITMLNLKYLQKTNSKKEGYYMKELSLEATVEHIEEVTKFIDDELDSLNCSQKTKMQINIAVDELFGNIAQYAYHPGKGNATVRLEIEKDPLTVVITFIDKGIPFDPLAKVDPNIHASVEERDMGGLGIFMVKKTMDGVKYVYEDGKNILEIKKQL